MIVFIDSGILGKLCNTNRTEETVAVNNWLFSLLGKGIYVVSSYICDYEVRRSLILESLRKSNIDSIKELDDLRNYIAFLPLTDEVMKEAASIWAEARIQGMPTADEKSLDADVIICAQYKLLEKEYPGRYIVIATTNVNHLSRFAEAKEWNDIQF
ncbi:MAG: type II toxin-antitoxin system VapC family toxin [Xenococcaceae cyanobacterium MO_167.B52]|nr:type II toxin-antitoxin system VapC family toxin [Xenococcaceae cyanobacterium MO_167.B52]